MLKNWHINCHSFNIRYTCIFQNEKYFCPDFLPSHEHSIKYVRHTIACILTPIGNQTTHSFIYFVHSAVFLFLSAYFCSLFLDIACYACKKTNESTLYIKQKSRSNHNNRFWLKVSAKQEYQILQYECNYSCRHYLNLE